jgi:hypothetical protein
MGDTEGKEVKVKYYIFADREKSDHHLLNSLGVIKLLYTEETKENPFIFGKIFMGNAFNEGRVVIPFFNHALNEKEEENNGVILNGDYCKYTEDSLNFSFYGKIEHDRLIEGKMIGASLCLNGKFDDDTMIEGTVFYQFVDGWQFTGKMSKKSINGPGLLQKMSKTGKEEERIEGEWTNGVHESKGHIIVYGDEAERAIRMVYISISDPNRVEKLNSPDAKITLTECLVRSSMFQGTLFRGEATLKKNSFSEHDDKLTSAIRYKLVAIREAILEKRVFVR